MAWMRLSIIGAAPTELTAATYGAQASGVELREKDNCQFGSDNNEVLIVDDEVLIIPLASKMEIAKSIFDVISQKI